MITSRHIFWGICKYFAEYVNLDFAYFCMQTHNDSFTSLDKSIIMHLFEYYGVLEAMF